MTKIEFVCVVVGFIIGALLGFAPLGGDALKYREVMRVCEANIPRSMTCDVVGVPFQTQKIYVDLSSGGPRA